MEMTLNAVKTAPVMAANGFRFSDSMEGREMRVATQRLNKHLLAMAEKGTEDAAFDTLLDGYLLNQWPLAVAVCGIAKAPDNATPIGDGMALQVDYRDGREDPIILRLYTGAPN
ncbi:MAG: hypothetical protein EON60_10355 [Alphaproteobacteria bacterium]|nr:MAG: hypothetical protein EON60_10355 [Alphaproteobacteria bacterium]